MTSPGPGDPSAAVVVELANLRGSFDRFARENARDLGEVKTSVAVLVERGQHIDEAVRQLRTDTDREVSEVRTDAAAVRADVESLKRWRWTLTGAAAAVGAVAGFAASLVGR